VNEVKAYTGPPATSGSTAAAAVRPIVWCNACRHRIEPDVAAMAGKYGAATPVRDWVSRLVCSQCGARDISCPHRGTAVGPIDSPNADCARRSRARLFGGLYRRGSEPAEIVSAAAPGRAPWWRRRFRETSSTSDGECGDGQSPRPTAPCDGTCRADSPIASIVSTLRSFSEL